MGLSKYQIGKLVDIYIEKCNRPNLTTDEVSGINKDKEFFEPARQVGLNTNDYKVVPPHYFACNLMHVGRDKLLPIALNRTEHNKYVSPAYTVFCINETHILRDYFFIMLKSNERDRYFWFHTDSSVRDGMSWNDFCELEISIPDLAIQQKYVDIYRALLTNQRAYERGLEDLKLACDATIENLRRKMPCEEIAPYISEINLRNNDLSNTNVQGVNSNGQFCETKANTAGIDFSNYKTVKNGQFAYNPSRISLGSIALSNISECIVSPMYVVFEVSKTDVILPQYLMMWYSRKEFQRSTLFYATGSVRDTFSFNIMQDVKIPIPDISIQQDIVNIYNAYTKRKKINERLKAQIKDLCPVLIKGSLEEAAAGKEA